VPDPLGLFWLFFKATLLSSGGLGNLPSLHEDLLARHWATEADFGAALAVGQVAPGPTGLWVVSLGFLVAGWWGAVLAVVAATLPPLLIVPIELLHRRFGDLAPIRDFVRGLNLAIVATFPVVMLRLVGAHGFDPPTLALVAASALLVASGRLPSVVVLALAAAAGVAIFS